MSSTIPLPIKYVGWHRRTSRQRDPEQAPVIEATDEANVVTVIEVSNWLEELGFRQYSQIFKDNEVNGDILRTLTSEELRDDLAVTNLRHRRDILDAIQRLKSTQDHPPEPLPEHGRILDHLSNVRTYHSWIRLGVQFMAFSLVTLRLAPMFRTTPLVTAASFYYALVGVLALIYGIFRYNKVINMIEDSGPSHQSYRPDRIGVLSMLLLVIIASTITLLIISLRVS